MTDVEKTNHDLKNVEFRLLNTGHFALEEDCVQIAHYILSFIRINKKNKMASSKPIKQVEEKRFPTSAVKEF